MMRCRLCIHVGLRFASAETFEHTGGNKKPAAVSTAGFGKRRCYPVLEVRRRVATRLAEISHQTATAWRALFSVPPDFMLAGLENIVREYWSVMHDVSTEIRSVMSPLIRESHFLPPEIM